MDYETKTIEIISAYLGKVKKNEQEITLDSRLVDIDIDSLDTIEISFLLEEEFKTSIEPDDLMKMNAESVKDLVIFIKKYVEKNQ
jgi:acyl carrier protein